jgi:Protein of unknown function (DUF1203)
MALFGQSPRLAEKPELQRKIPIVSGAPNPYVRGMQYHIKALPDGFTERIRATLRDDAGNELSIWTSDSHGNPCRSCLRRTKPGERLILCAYTPFDGAGPYVERGPIFIHAEPCERYERAAGFPADFQGRPITLRAYGSTPRGALSIVEAFVAEPGSADATLNDLFADERVEFVHARNPAWGCYDFCVERAD